MVQLSYELKENMIRVNENLAVLCGLTRDIQYRDGKLAQDYFCWLNNALYADYSAIFCLLSNLYDINKVDLRPIYCIMRSSLEKYADILNLVERKEEYYPYLQYLNDSSMARLLKENYIYYANSKEEEDDLKKKADDFKKSADENNKRVKESLKQKHCNRRTRYYLARELSEINELFSKSDDSYKYIIPNDICDFFKSHSKSYDFSKKLLERDSKYSQIAHNNIEIDADDNPTKVKEILINVNYMMLDSVYLLGYYYGTEDFYNKIEFYNNIVKSIVRLFNSIKISVNNKDLVCRICY